MNVVGGEMFDFCCVAVNQGFTQKINVFEKNTPVLHKLQYQRLYLSVFDHTFMMSVLKH